MGGTQRRLQSARSGILAGAVVFLTLIGAGPATALWSTEKGVGPFTADAATVGVSHTVGGGLTHTYTSSSLTAAQAVTVTNTGNREAAYAVTVSTTSASDLLSHVRARLAVVANPVACTPSATLPSPVVEQMTMTSPITLTSAPGALAAGSTATVCVQTVMSAVSGHGGKTLTGTIVSSTSAAAQVGWSASTTAVSFTQSVESVPSTVEIKTNAWYWIRSASSPSECVETLDYSGTSVVLRPDCADESSWDSNRNELWRFEPYNGGYRVVSFYHENHGAHQTLFWSAGNGNGNPITVGTSGHQDTWAPTYHSDGTVSFSSPSTPKRCATLNGTTLVSVNGNCSSSNGNQKFVLDMLATVEPPPVTLTCSGDEWTLYSSWPPISPYQQWTTHRVLLDNVVVPGDAYSRATAHDPVVQFGSSNAALHSFLATHGYGTKVLRVEHSIMGGAWTLTGNRNVTFNASSPVLQCGP